MTIFNDSRIEEDETIQVSLTSTDGAVDFVNNATIFIADDDGMVHYATVHCVYTLHKVIQNNIKQWGITKLEE